MESLKHTQQWLQGVITHPRGVEQGAAHTVVNEKVRPIDSVVSPSAYLNSEERINVYHMSYFLRLIECFKSEFKGLRNALGEDLFKHFVWGYLQTHPPTSYTLNELGRRFPDYLQTTLYDSLEGNIPDSWQLFIIDMAKYERMYTEVYHGEGHEATPSDDVFGLNPLKLSPSVRTLKLQFPIADCIGRFRDIGGNDLPDQKMSRYVFSRDQFRVKVRLVNDKEWRHLHVWVNDSTEACPAYYRDVWLENGIGYS